MYILLTHCTGGDSFARWRSIHLPGRGGGARLPSKPPIQLNAGQGKAGIDQRKTDVICFLCTGMPQGAASAPMAATLILVEHLPTRNGPLVQEGSGRLAPYLRHEPGGVLLSA